MYKYKGLGPDLDFYVIPLQLAKQSAHPFIPFCFTSELANKSR